MGIAHGRIDKSWWDVDSEFPLEDWKYEVVNNDTRLGYWDWVQIQRTLERDEDD